MPDIVEDPELSSGRAPPSRSGTGPLALSLAPHIPPRTPRVLLVARASPAGLGASKVSILFLHRPYDGVAQDRKSTRLNSSHANISYAVFCLKKKNSTYVDSPQCRHRDRRRRRFHQPSADRAREED